MSAAEDPEVTLETLRTLLRMIEEKTRLVQLLDDYIERRRADDRHRLRAQRAGPAALQPGRLDLLRRPHGTGAVGVIGPTRMRYSRAINAVDRCPRPSAGWSASRP